MNSWLVALWAAVGLGAGALLAPAASWLAGTTPNRLRQVLIAGLTTATFLLIAWRCPTWPDLLAQSVFAAVAVQLAVIDILTRRLPRTLIWPTCLAITGILATETIATNDVTRLLRAGAAALILTGGYLAIAVASRGGLGAGDVRLAVLIGGLLGWHSWPALITGATLGFAGTGLAAALLAARRRAPATLPHGPGMLIGATIVLLL